ncbi:MAG: S8 family serine peptidase [Chloroflexi bacterium]|nr:S8 family serine peptidase [Chloroflexota bacterium]
MRTWLSRASKLLLTIALLTTSATIPVEGSDPKESSAISISPWDETTASFSSQDGWPPFPVPDTITQATRPGKYPAQLTGSADGGRLDRRGPQRTDPAEGIPTHAYSPFDERNNREHPCPPGGCEFQSGTVLVKLAPHTPDRPSGAQVAMTGDESLNRALAAQGVLRLDPVFPEARPPKAGESVVSASGVRVPKPDLTGWYRATLSQSADVYSATATLAANPAIAYAEPDYLRKPVGEPVAPASGIRSSAPQVPENSGDPMYAQQWHLGAATIPQAWAYLESQGLPPGGSRDIVVAVIDTGVDYNHPDLAANIWTNSREIAGNGVDDDGNGYVDDVHGVDVITNSGAPQDDHGHGTHVAGIIGAQANNGRGGVGVAYNVQILPIKAAQYSGVLATSDIAEAIYYAVNNGADVINMSFGGYSRSQVEEDALTVAFGQAVLVAAAGNDGEVNEPCPFGRDMYPAAYNWVLGVMASAPDGSRADFSNYDCTPRDTHEYELMAPGMDVWSTLPREQYSAWDGTSMAAPVVSGIAALARTKWSDKDVYSSRFIMGQIAANASPVANAYAALTVAPKPELSYLEHWLFDTTAQSATNDDDGIVDAGETVDLAIVVRNHWGKADPVTVTLQAWADGAFQPDPYVTMITDTVDYGAIGSFNWDDNGLIYDAQGVITGVRHPFRFTVANTTPNDHVIPFRLTLTARNGLDPTDTTTYTFQSRFYLIVQRGRVLPGVISEDMVLTKDYFWIVGGTTYVIPGVAVTVTQGAQVQWGGPLPTDPYAEPTRAMLGIWNGASLSVQGTYTEPVELFPWAIPSNLAPDVYITNGEAGRFEVRYAKILAPEWGTGGAYSGPDLIDHAHLFGDSIWTGKGFTLQGIPAAITNSIIDLPAGWGLGASTTDTVLFHARQASQSFNFWPGLVKNSVFLQNNAENYVWSGWLSGGEVFSTEADAAQSTRNVNNAFLSKYWDPNLDHWMRQRVGFPAPNLYVGFSYNFWGTTSALLIDAAIRDGKDDYGGAPTLVYQPILTVPATTTYPFAWDVALSTASSPRTTIVGSERVTFTVAFNRDMDPSVQPAVSFGPDTPVTDYTVHPVDGGWQDARTWVGTFDVNPITGDGYQLIRVAGARAADDPWLVTGDDSGRFRFEIITSGTEAMNLQATGGEGYVDLAWTQTDFDLLAGFNIYRSTSATGPFTRINTALIPSGQRSYRDSSVQPGIPYYYRFTVVKSDISESNSSNVATATPIDTVPPVISHTLVTSAPPQMSLSLYADVSDNVGVQGVTLYFRPISATTYISRTMVKTTGNRYSATIEGSRLASPGLEYYIEATDGVSIARAARPEYPYQITVVDRPVVTTISPNRGPSSGGTIVTIAGSNFKDGATVTFGGAVGISVTVVSASQITAITPPHFPAQVDVTVVNTDAQSGTLLRGFSYESDIASLSLPATGGEQRSIVEVPLNTASIHGLAAADLLIAFDSAVLSARGARTGTLTPGWSLAANTNVPGQIRLSLASAGGTVDGSGSLAIVEFDIVGSPGLTSTLHLASVSLNDGAIPAQTADGSFQVNLVYDVSGAVRYWSGGVAVRDVALALNGDIGYSGRSGETGAYTVTNIARGTYTLTPSKSDGATGITAYDASLVLRHSVGLIDLTGHAATAADVNKNGSISSMDAFYILQKAVDLIALPFPGAGVVWDFDPRSRSYASLDADRANEDFTAVLLGDVSGNWGAGASRPAIAAVQQPLLLTVAQGKVSPGGLVTATVALDATGAQVYSLDLALSYSSGTASLVSVAPGPLASNWNTSTNVSQPGQVKVAMASTSPLAGHGELLNLTFRTTRLQAGNVNLALVRSDADEGSIPVQVNYGTSEDSHWKVYLPLVRQ